MAEYHFYLLNPQSQIQSRKIAQCAGDLDAFEFAQGVKWAGDIEIWLGSRLLTRMNSVGDRVPGSPTHLSAPPE
jgi:hypothetical protein